jgi:hypothetical protein
MIRKTVLALALGAAVFGVGSVASAQYYDRDYGYDRDHRYDRGHRWNGDFPRGSWDRTCRDARMNGPILRARCDNGRGRWIYTQIDVRACPGERIRNTWGQLTCERGYGYGGGWSGGLPAGSWGETCRQPRMRGSVLTAVCDDGNYRWRTTSIDVRRCYNGRVKNSWGRLICD